MHNSSVIYFFTWKEQLTSNPPLSTSWHCFPGSSSMTPCLKLFLSTNSTAYTMTRLWWTRSWYGYLVSERSYVYLSKRENTTYYPPCGSQNKLRERGELLMFQLGFDAEAFGLVFASDYKTKVLAGEEGRVTQAAVEKFFEKVLSSCTDLSFSKDKMLREFLFTDSEITYARLWSISHYFTLTFLEYCHENGRKGNGVSFQN